MSFKILYIIAGNLNEFEAWYDKVEKNGGISKYKTSGFSYLAHPDNLIGQRNVEGLFIGTWYNRPDIFSILFNLRNLCTTDEKRKKMKKIIDKLYEMRDNP